jgi:mannose-6-phosphate isomerase
LDSVNVKEGDGFSRNREGTRYRAGLLVAEISKLLTLEPLHDFDRAIRKGIQETSCRFSFSRNYYKRVNTRIEYSKEENESNTIVNRPYFTTESFR